MGPLRIATRTRTNCPFIILGLPFLFLVVSVCQPTLICTVCMPMLFALCLLSGVWQLVSGFYPGRNTLQPIFFLRHLQHAARTIKPDGLPNLHGASLIIILSKPMHIPRDALWKHLRRTCMPAPLLSVIQDMYNHNEYVYKMVIRLLVCIRLVG